MLLGITSSLDTRVMMLAHDTTHKRIRWRKNMFAYHMILNI